jgi:hypothetical protein
VFRLLRSLVSLALLGGFIWFGLEVPLGSKPLFGHLRAIFSSAETHELVEGAKEAARPVIQKVEHELIPDGGPADRSTRRVDERARDHRPAHRDGRPN